MKKLLLLGILLMTVSVNVFAECGAISETLALEKFMNL